ncbi:MAG: GntR family transcriptional regulator [Nitrosospira sp.]|nr:GntR family transcriptional regulator [Nitrosospira sp.]
MMSKLTKLKARPDYVDEVYKILLDAICDGTLIPGGRITQEEIAEQLSVSRSPVLQAIRLLKNDGFLEDAPGRGVQVTALDPAWIAHVYEIRGALDGLAARLAAKRKKRIDPRLIENGRKAATGYAVKDLINSDMAFHSALYQASGNPLIAQTARLHWVHLRRVMGAVLQSSGQRESIWDEHEGIAAAIKKGDVTLAGELSERHTRRASENLLHRLNEVLAEESEP